MPTNQVSIYLKYANLQMAAEALFDQRNQPPGSVFAGPIRPEVLTLGNERSSRFPTALAEQFALDWTVVEHKSDTKTGFRGRRMTRLVRLSVIAVASLVGCYPSEQRKAELAEMQRIECFEKICEGDIEPKRDEATETIAKINGQWLIGPKNYGSPLHLAFFWPSKTPARGEDAPRTAPEFIPSAAGVNSNFYDVSIEIFLRHHDGGTYGPQRYERLLQAKREGRLTSRELLRPGLEVWRIQEPSRPGSGIWYVATSYVESDPNGAVLWCRDESPANDHCSTAFRWHPGISADMRFSAKHRADWPEIYRETQRVLSLLRKA